MILVSLTFLNLHKIDVGCHLWSIYVICNNITLGRWKGEGDFTTATFVSQPVRVVSSFNVDINIYLLRCTISVFFHGGSGQKLLSHYDSPWLLNDLYLFSLSNFSPLITLSTFSLSGSCYLDHCLDLTSYLGYLVFGGNGSPKDFEVSTAFFRANGYSKSISSLEYSHQTLNLWWDLAIYCSWERRSDIQNGVRGRWHSRDRRKKISETCLPSTYLNKVLGQVCSHKNHHFKMFVGMASHRSSKYCRCG